MLSFINYLGVQSKLIKKIYARKDLNLVDKNIYIEIIDLSATSGVCTAKNSYFMNGFGISEATVKRSLQKLEEMEMIRVGYKVARQGRQITLVQNELTRLAQNEPTLAQNDLVSIGQKVDDSTFKPVKNEGEYKREYKILSNDNTRPDVYGNALINYAISEFKRIIGYEPASRGAYTSRMQARHWIQVIQRILRENLREGTDEEVKVVITRQLESIKKEGGEWTLLRISPLKERVPKFIAQINGGRS